MRVSKRVQKEIEFWEKYYLDQMSFMLLQDKHKMINALNSKDEIKSDWIDVFLKKSCDIDRGAERIYFWLFNQLGIPNSTPIGSDLLYETSNAFLHIDVKTSAYYTGEDKKKNTSDFLGRVSIGQNQTSYEYIEKKDGKKIKHSSNLPPIYKTKDKFCLTYIIQLVYDRAADGDLIIISIFLISVPNGMLKSVYGNEICGGSKNKNEAFRYYYKRNPKFSLFPNNPYRITKLYLREGFSEKDILDFEIK